MYDTQEEWARQLTTGQVSKQVSGAILPTRSIYASSVLQTQKSTVQEEMNQGEALSTLASEAPYWDASPYHTAHIVDSDESPCLG